MEKYIKDFIPKIEDMIFEDEQTTKKVGSWGSYFKPYLKGRKHIHQFNPYERMGRRIARKIMSVFTEELMNALIDDNMIFKMPNGYCYLFVGQLSQNVKKIKLNYNTGMYPVRLQVIWTYKGMKKTNRRIRNIGASKEIFWRIIKNVENGMKYITYETALIEINNDQKLDIQTRRGGHGRPYPYLAEQEDRQMGCS